jgi:hypothetical protein
MSYDYDFTRFESNCVGSCFSGASTVSVLNEATRSVASVPLHSVKVGDKVRAVDHRTRKETFSKVVGLPHSASSGSFVDVQLRKHEGGQAHRVLATEHHTFPLCDTAFRVEKAAMDLKPGDCLLTEGGGKNAVESVDRVAAKEGDVTYTVVLDGADDLVVVGGVVTHARPSKAALTHSMAPKSTLESVRKKMDFLQTKVRSIGA